MMSEFQVKVQAARAELRRTLGHDLRDNRENHPVTSGVRALLELARAAIDRAIVSDTLFGVVDNVDTALAEIELISNVFGTTER